MREEPKERALLLGVKLNDGEDFVRSMEELANLADPDVQAAVQKVADELGDTGRILVRESGTEPLIRVMVEAETHDICQKYVDDVVNVINEKEKTR